MNIQPYYVALCEFDDLGLAHASDPTNFDDACEAYADKRIEGIEAAVFRIDPPVGGKAGMVTDVTGDADFRVKMWCQQRNEDAPEWLLEAA